MYRVYTKLQEKIEKYLYMCVYLYIYMYIIYTYIFIGVVKSVLVVTSSP